VSAARKVKKAVVRRKAKKGRTGRAFKAAGKVAVAVGAVAAVTAGAVASARRRTISGTSDSGSGGGEPPAV
jgi:hypothetical protein